MRFTRTLALGLTLAGTGCASLSQATRDDVRARMASIQAPLGACFEAALTRNRKLGGTIVVGFVADKASGKFIEVTVKRNDLPDPELERCVVEQVATLKLDKPTGNRVGVEYPIEFAAVD
jgi:hypothetical protein